MRHSLPIVILLAFVIAGCAERTSTDAKAAVAATPVAAARAHQADGVRLVLVSADFDDQMAETHHFLNSQGVHDTTYLKRQTDRVFIDALNPKWTGTIPATFVYDASGRRVAFWEGRADRARFEAAIRHALD